MSEHADQNPDRITNNLERLLSDTFESRHAGASTPDIDTDPEYRHQFLTNLFNGSNRTVLH